MTDSTAPEKIVINGQEYDPEDATQLIELGNKWKETESKLNTSLDKVYPEYTKAAQRAKQLEEELAKRTAELEEAQKAAKPKVEPNSDLAQIRKAAREAGLADQDYLKEQGYMTREEMKAFLDEDAKLKEAAKGVLDQAHSLETEIDGSDGRVPFNPDAVMAYAFVNNIPDLKEAYDKMNTKYNAAWEERKLAEAQKPGLTTLKAGGKKEPEQPKITNNNLGPALGEWLDSIQQG